MRAILSMEKQMELANFEMEIMSIVDISRMIKNMGKVNKKIMNLDSKGFFKMEKS